MATLHSSTTQRRPGKDEPEDLRQLRQDHGGSLATLKELFADWTEEDLLYAIQDAGGDVELAILRISEGMDSVFFLGHSFVLDASFIGAVPQTAFLSLSDLRAGKTKSGAFVSERGYLSARVSGAWISLITPVIG